VLLDVAERLRRRGFTDLQFINLGGGLGIDYEQHVHISHCHSLRGGIVEL